MVSSSELTRIIVCEDLVMDFRRCACSWQHGRGSRRGDKDQVAARSSHGVGTPIDFNRACARAALAFIPSRYVLTSFPDRFSTLHPSCQYSSICASVSADPRASLPCALHAAAIRRTAALNFGCSRSRWTPSCALRSECPYAIMSMPSTAAIFSTFSRPSSDSIDGNMMMFSLAHGAYSVAWRGPWLLYPVRCPWAEMPRL